MTARAVAGCLAPWLFLLDYLARREQRRDGKTGSGAGSIKADFPTFAVGFVLLSVVNSAVAIPAPLLAAAKRVSNMCLAMAMAALGVESNMSKVAAVGAAPLYLAACDYAFMVVGGYFVTRAATAYFGT